MKSTFSVLVALLGLTSSAFAKNIVCIGESSMGGKVRVEIASDKVILSSELLPQPRIIKKLTKVNGLITGPGLAITMDNHYGCLRNAVIISEFRLPLNGGYMEAVNVYTCDGGSTPDDACHAYDPAP